jgi:hypothetical protein
VQENEITRRWRKLSSGDIHILTLYIIFRHEVDLLGNGREISNYATAITRQQCKKQQRKGVFCAVCVEIF